jgi:hypothetical protein
MEANETWECYLCGLENNFNKNPSGYLANYHPLCGHCADGVLQNEGNKHRFRLTYHDKIGDLKMISNIPVDDSYPNWN